MSSVYNENALRIFLNRLEKNIQFLQVEYLLDKIHHMSSVFLYYN